MIDNDGMVQVRATFSLGLLPAIEPREDGDGGVDDRRELAERLAVKYGAAAVFHGPEYEIDEETRAALTASRDEGLPLVLLGRNLEFGDGDCPLFAHHVPLALADDLTVGVRDDDVTLTGWIPARFADGLARYDHCSPGIQIRRARRIDVVPGMSFVSVTKAVLVELSATEDPRLDGTTFTVGKTPGKRYWRDPDETTAERFTERIEGRVSLSGFPSTIEVFGGTSTDKDAEGDDLVHERKDH